MASGSESGDNTIRLWDLATGKERAVLAGHTEWVTSLSFSPDGQTLASGSSDNTIRLWNLGFLHDLRPPEEQVKAAEAQFGLHLVDLQLQPVPPERNLYGVSPQPPRWSRQHPLHWLPAAERGDPQAMLQIGILYDRADDLPRAETWYRKAADTGEPKAREWLEALPRPQAALPRQQAAAIWKTLPEGAITPAQYDQAIDLCNRVIALDPSHTDAYWLRRQILYDRKETRQAEADYRKVISQAPQFAGAHGRLGWLLITQSRFAEALPMAQQAHELDPKSDALAVNLGHAYLLTGNRQTAHEYYEKTIHLIPDEAALTSDLLADFDLFIEKGWQVEACREEAAWFRQRFEEKE